MEGESDLVLGKQETMQVPVVSFRSYSSHSRCLITSPPSFVPCGPQRVCVPMCTHTWCSPPTLPAHSHDPQHSGGCGLLLNYPDSDKIMEERGEMAGLGAQRFTLPPSLSPSLRTWHWEHSSCLPGTEQQRLGHGLSQMTLSSGSLG